MKRPTVRVYFEEVGRIKKSWEVDVPQCNVFPPEDAPRPDYKSMLRSLRASNALVSREIDVDAADGTCQHGVVLAGGRVVGKWRVLPPKGEHDAART